MRTVTLPPPEEASMVICCIFSCSFSACCRACASMSCKLNPSILAVRLSLFAFRQRSARETRPSSPLFVIDDRPYLGAELFLHALHDGVGQGARARASAIARRTRSRFRFGRCCRCSAHHLELQRPGGELPQCS